MKINNGNLKKNKKIKIIIVYHYILSQVIYRWVIMLIIKFYLVKDEN